MGKTGGAVGYKTLKKRMSAVFRTIRTDLGGGSLPRPEDARAYLDDGRRMCAFTGKGDPMYPAFMTVLDLFEAALASGDVAGAGRLAEEMQRMKKECHGRFK
jgi:XXXCH domain-containing protein